MQTLRAPSSPALQGDYIPRHNRGAMAIRASSGAILYRQAKRRALVASGRTAHLAPARQVLATGKSRRSTLLAELGAGLGASACLVFAGIMASPTGYELISWMLEVSA